MPPYTKFAVKDPYKYLEGFGLYHQSEAIPGANPKVINTPQRPPFNLRTERISGTSFTAPRHANLQTWLYRVTSSLEHSEFVPYDSASEVSNPPPPTHLTPNSYMWPTFPVSKSADWLHQPLLARNGDPQTKTGLAVYLFSATKDMTPQTVFSSLDGETLIVPQAGALDILTEMGKMLVRQNEIAVVPRSVRYRITLPDGKPCRGYIIELFEGHFRLPDLGIVGSTGLANVRDFQVPVACFDGELMDNESGNPVMRANRADGEKEWTIISRLAGRLWSCTQTRSPFDVVAWHGTCYPYKYDLGRYCVLGNMLFDEHDPSLYVVLTAPANGSAPGTAVADFAIVPPRWQVAEGTYWLPYFHRNTMQEFYAPIVNRQDRVFEGRHFAPFGAGLNGSMVTHGASEGEWRAAMAVDTYTPVKVQDEGITLFLVETERPLYLTKWAYECAQKNFRVKPKGAAKM